MHLFCSQYSQYFMFCGHSEVACLSTGMGVCNQSMPGLVRYGSISNFLLKKEDFTVSASSLFLYCHNSTIISLLGQSFIFLSFSSAVWTNKPYFKTQALKDLEKKHAVVTHFKNLKSDMNKNDLDYSFTEINSVGSQQDQILHLDWVFVNSGIAGTQDYFDENLLSEGATDV